MLGHATASEEQLQEIEKNLQWHCLPTWSWMMNQADVWVMAAAHAPFYPPRAGRWIFFCFEVLPVDYHSGLRWCICCIRRKSILQRIRSFKLLWTYQRLQVHMVHRRAECLSQSESRLDSRRLCGKDAVFPHLGSSRTCTHFYLHLDGLDMPQKDSIKKAPFWTYGDFLWPKRPSQPKL